MYLLVKCSQLNHSNKKSPKLRLLMGGAVSGLCLENSLAFSMFNSNFSVHR